jgi:hypothetical protein
MTLVSHGCPIPAIVAAFGVQAQTVREWTASAGRHAEAIHTQQIQQPRDLQHVQADAIPVTTQGGRIWMALALMVTTRLWLGGTVSRQRDGALIHRVLAIVAACAQLGPLVSITDGLQHSVTAVRTAVRQREPVPRGRPRLVPWPDLALVHVITQYRGRVVTGVVERLVQGTLATAQHLLRQTPGCRVFTTACIERLNGTFRSNLAVLGRRTRRPARLVETLTHGMYVVGTVYNFCMVHTSLTTSDGQARTPAMAAGITDHCWTVRALVTYRVPPPPWQPPRRRGRRSKALQAVIDRWCPNHRSAYSYPGYGLQLHQWL